MLPIAKETILSRQSLVCCFPPSSITTSRVLVYAVNDSISNKLRYRVLREECSGAGAMVGVAHSLLDDGIYYTQGSPEAYCTCADPSLMTSRRSEIHILKHLLGVLLGLCGVPGVRDRSLVATLNLSGVSLCAVDFAAGFHVVEAVLSALLSLPRVVRVGDSAFYGKGETKHQQSVRQ